MPKSVNKDDAQRLVTEFLVDKPLYSPLRFVLDEKVSSTATFYPPALRRHCARCRNATNWTARGLGAAGNISVPRHEGGHLISYGCVQCGVEVFALWIRQTCSDAQQQTMELGGGMVGLGGEFGSTFELKKLGQWMPWSINPDPELEAVLDDSNLHLYKNGLMNMSAGYGIGAVAYFRRVIENETQRLIDELVGIAEQEHDDATLSRLNEARASRNADERLRLAAGATPAWLRVGGLNPLKSLYDHFSVGIHALDDEACLEIATKLRTAFEYVFKTIRHHSRARAELARVLT